MADPKIFSLEGKGLKLDSAEDIAQHIAALKEAPDVEEVRFQGNTLGIGASEALAAVLKTKQKLQVANLADIFTSRLLSEIPPALQALLDALLTLPNLHTVNLSDNAFGLNTQAPLVSFLSAHTPLQHLILNNNGLGPAAGTLIANALAILADKKAAASAAPLQTVVCGRNRLENGSMEAWAKAYAKHTHVQEVKMVQNGIRQEGITHLLKTGLAHASELKVLDLQDNTFTAMGARALADVVHGWASLEELGVGDCLLSARGGVALGEALAKGKNGKLEVLRLQYNEIDSKGLKSLADAASQSGLERLRRDELNGNRYNEDDDNVDRLRTVLDERRENEGEKFTQTDDDDWGLDELDELEDESEEEDEEGPEDEEDEEEGIKVKDKADEELKRTEEAEDENVPLEKDKKVDELADLMGKTSI